MAKEHRLHIQLDEETHQWLRLKAFKEKASMAQIVRDTLRDAKKAGEAVNESQ